jgi:hypothetical protein
MKRLLLLIIPVLSFMLISCSSSEDKAKKAVEEFAKMAKEGDNEGADIIYPIYGVNFDFDPISKYAKVGDITITSSEITGKSSQCDTCTVLADNAYRDADGNYKKVAVKFIVSVKRKPIIEDSYGLIQFSPEDGKILTKAGAIYDETTDRFITASMNDFKTFLNYIKQHSDEIDINSFTGKEYGDFLQAYTDYLNKHRGDL